VRNEPQEEAPQMPEPTKVIVTLRALSVASATAGEVAQREVVFEHASVTNLSQAGVIIANVEGRVIGYFPYEVVESVVAPNADKPKSKIVVPEAVIALH
jgi:hypothetical protein